MRTIKWQTKDEKNSSTIRIRISIVTNWFDFWSFFSIVRFIGEHLVHVVATLNQLNSTMLLNRNLVDLKDGQSFLNPFFFLKLYYFFGGRRRFIIIATTSNVSSFKFIWRKCKFKKYTLGLIKQKSALLFLDYFTFTYSFKIKKLMIFIIFYFYCSLSKDTCKLAVLSNAQPAH